MTEPRLDVPVTGGRNGRGSSFGWRRRQFVVDARYQLRSGVIVALVAFVLLILLNASLILPQRSASSPGVLASDRAQTPFEAPEGSSFALMLLGSAIFLGGVFLVGFLESHRTAGAAYAIRRAVDGLRDGESQVRVRLRRGDHLQELARSINQLAETIESERLRRS